MDYLAEIPNVLSRFEGILSMIAKRDQALLDTISPLIKRFEEILASEKQRLHESIILVKSVLPRLLDSIEMVLERTTIQVRKYAPDFNIFQILKLERKEVGTHSAFLANLLDPHGFHGQGSLFLNAFLEKIGIETASGKWRVETEKWAGYVDDINYSNLGRMDIVLKNERSAIVIENKIDHVDEPHQLWRYGKWLENEYGPGCLREKKHFRIVYLTPSGRKPTDNSIEKQYKDDSFNLKEDIGCITKLSYKKDLSEWLTLCWKNIEEAPPVKTVIDQYLRIIRRILNE